jgi:hypothetical protein
MGLEIKLNTVSVLGTRLRLASCSTYVCLHSKCFPYSLCTSAPYSHATEGRNSCCLCQGTTLAVYFTDKFLLTEISYSISEYETTHKHLKNTVGISYSDHKYKPVVSELLLTI